MASFWMRSSRLGFFLGFFIALLPEYDVRRYGRSALGGRFRLGSCPHGRAAGLGRRGVLPLPAGPGVGRSGGRGPSQPEPVPGESPFRTPRRRPASRPWLDRPVWSDPTPPSTKRSRLPDAPVPGGSPAGPEIGRGNR